MAEGSKTEISPQRRRAVAAALALAGALSPLPIPLTGLHKFYLGQPIWGGVYFVLGWTQIPRVACAVEGVWYLLAPTIAAGGWQASLPWLAERHTGTPIADQTQAIAAAVRELEQLRQDGLISEVEFEQKRRSLIEQIG